MWWLSLRTEVWLVAVAVLACSYLWLRRRYKYFERLGIPYLEPTPILGNTYRSLLGKEQLSASYARIYDQLKGHKMGGVFQLFNPILVLRDPGLVQQVMTKEFASFHGHGFQVDEATNPLEGHLFNLEGEKWRALRKALSPTFTSGRIKWMFEQIDACARSLVATISNEARAGGEIEVKDLLARFTTDVIGSCAFGLEPEAIKNPDCKFRVFGKKVFEPSLKSILLFAFRSGFPRLFRWLRVRTMDREMEAFFTRVVRQAFAHRLQTGQARRDFVQLLLQLREKGKIDYDPKDKDEIEEPTVGPLDDEDNQSLELTDEVLTAQAFVFFIAGFETSSTTMSLALYLLAKEEGWQERVREEVRRVKAAHGGSISYQALKEMPLLEACLKESMRLLPPLDLLFRRCNKDCILDGKRLEKGTRVMIPIRCIQADPAFFPDPQQFRPERFLPGGQEVLPGSYLPFGDGPRICIARRFALVEAQLGLAVILDNFRVRRGPSLKEPLEFHPRSFINTPLGGMWMQFEPLQDAAPA